MIAAIRMWFIIPLLTTVSTTEDSDMAFRALHDRYVATYKPLVIESARAWWEASISGTDQAFERRKKAENALVELHSDRATYAQLNALREANQIQDPLLRRSLLVMRNNFLPYQVDPQVNKQIVALSADVEQIFNAHRGQVGAKPRTENEIRKILKETHDSALAREAWLAYMQVGREVDDKLKLLIKLRNQVARDLGFENYFAMQMDIQELDETELLALFDALDRLTRQPFAELKKEIDAHMMQRFGITAEQLRPWHTADLFFQEAPDLSAVSLDDMYHSRDPVKLSAAHYLSLGLEVDDILQRSDLYEKEGKSPHAFCTSIDRQQDVRVLCNVQPNANWMDTMHHELGHGVYDKYIRSDVPFVLHGPAHTLTTEGIAMLFGALTKNEAFIRTVIKLPEEQVAAYAAEARRSLRAEKLIFSRWAQVMLRFEHAMYKNPNQDLNRLWWDLKKKYQLLNPPDDLSGADYGAKIHVVAAPVYYHNYMLGDLFASQVIHHAGRTVLHLDDPYATCFYGSKEMGHYLRDKIFGPGNLNNWRELTRQATGEPLTPKYYAEQFMD